MPARQLINICDVLYSDHCKQVHIQAKLRTWFPLIKNRKHKNRKITNLYKITITIVSLNFTTFHPNVLMINETAKCTFHPSLSTRDDCLHALTDILRWRPRHSALWYLDDNTIQVIHSKCNHQDHQDQEHCIGLKDNEIMTV